MDLGGIKTGHIAGITNELADFLSRISAPGSKKVVWPPELVGVKWRKIVIVPSRDFRLPTPADSEVWGAAENKSALAVFASVCE